MKDLVHQPVLNGLVGQHLLGPLGVELAGLRQGGQVHDRAGAPLAGGGQERVVLQRKQAAGGGDAVGKGRQIGEVGELLGQKPRLDEGIGVAVEGGGT